MTCDQLREFLDPHVDGELDVLRSAEFTRHLRTCEACRQLCDRHEKLREVLQLPELYFQLPAQLEQRIRERVRRSSPQPSAMSLHRRVVIARGPVLAAVAAVIALLSVIPVMWFRTSRPDPLTNEIVSSHIRSLMAEHVTDVSSSDQHTVKPWFSGKVDFAPVVKDLRTDNFPLKGGRLEYVNGRAVVALVYQRNQHKINLFCWPSPEADSPSQTANVRGYNLVHWTRLRMAYWAVSDLNATELQRFVRDIRN
jgi:anti-sigma factor RsiW